MLKRLIERSTNHPPALTTDLAVIWGAFLMEGLMVSASDASRPARILDTWRGGCIELVIEVCQAVEIACRRLQPYWLNQEPFPSVFEYEVFSELGYCIGEHLLARGELPGSGQIEQIAA